MSFIILLTINPIVETFKDNRRAWPITKSDHYTFILVWVEPLCFPNGNTDDANEHKSNDYSTNVVEFDDVSYVKWCISINTNDPKPMSIHVSIDT